MKAKEMNVQQLANYIDYSVLKPEFSKSEIEHQVQLAVDFGSKTVCINPWAIDIAKPITQDSKTGLCVVCNFPFGTNTHEARMAETKAILAKGDIEELDIVMNYGMLRSGMHDEITSDLKAITQLCHKENCLVKVIFETDALTKEEIKQAVECSVSAGVDFIKTSTGFYTGEKQHEQVGGFREMIQYMIDCADGRAKVKASAAIRDRQHFLDLIDMGVDRMGVGFNSVPIVLNSTVEEVKSQK